MIFRQGVISHDLKYSVPAAISLLITAIYNIVDRVLLETSTVRRPWPAFDLFPLFYMMMAFGLYLQCRRFVVVQLVCRKRGAAKHESRLWQFPNLSRRFELLLTAFCFSLPIPSYKSSASPKRLMNMPWLITVSSPWAAYFKG